MINLKRGEVEQRLLRGLTRAQIAKDLAMTKGAVDQQCHKIFKQHRVRSQRALLKKNDKPLPEHLQLTRDRIRDYIHAGRPQKEIARTLGITLQAVQQYISQLRKRGGLP